MPPDGRWIVKYNEVVEFINANHRNPSRYRRHRIEENDILNWLEPKKKMNAGAGLGCSKSCNLLWGHSNQRK